MKSWVWRGALLAALLALGLWAGRHLFPSPEQIIRQRLAELARTVCIQTNEGALVKLARAQKVASFFATDAEIALDLPGRSLQALQGRNDIMQTVAGAGNALSSLKVQFLDISVNIGGDLQSASAHFTVKADVPGESTPQVEELQADFKRIERDWLIQRVTNVRTLR